MSSKVRQDKFIVGDKVTWSDDHYATLTDGRKRNGDGPFEVVEVIDREGSFPLSSIVAMAHTQHLKMNFDCAATYSGAFFKKVEVN